MIEQGERGNNFLFLGVGNHNIPVTIVKKLVLKFDIKNAYATIYEGEDASLFKETINIWDAFYGIYPHDDFVKPFDRAYDNPISQYSVEILHQLARHGNWDFEKRVNIYYKHLLYWDSFLKTREINYVIFSWIPHESYDYIIYLLCKMKNIKTCMGYRDSLRYFITKESIFMLNSIENHTAELKKVYMELSSVYECKKEEEITLPVYAEKYIDEIKRRFAGADKSDMKLLSNRRFSKLKHDFGEPQKAFRELIENKMTTKEFIQTCCSYGSGIYKTKKLIKKYEKLSVLPDFADKYFFYALHYQPECTSSPLGGVYASQFLAIQLIAYNLPEGYWVYVKEHPDQTSVCRNVNYYEELLKIPKVKIISQKVTSEILIKNAIAVVTLTGTVMFESQIFQKPCLCLGYSHMEILNGVYKINTNEDCKKAIDEIIAGQQKVTTFKEIKLFWLAMGELCFDTEDEEAYYNKLVSHINIASK